MYDRFTFSSAGMIHELELAMDRVGGWNSALVKTLCMGNNLGKVRDYLRGIAEVKPVERLIDCDAKPFEPNGLTVESHKKDGKLVWDPEKVKLYFSRQQGGEKCIEGNQLRKELEGKPVLNANVLDYLLAHQELIPEDWKGKYVFFWGTIYRGTIYRDSCGILYVRCLCFCDGWWRWRFLWLGNWWGYDRPAALRAS